MGYANSVVEESLKQQKFDDCYASYLLLGRRNTDFLFQLDSEGSRSGSSLSLRAMAPGVGGQGSQPAPSPAHTGSGSSGGHRGVQRSISATSGNKPRRGSTGAENSTTTCELPSGPGSNGGESQGGQGWIRDCCQPTLSLLRFLVLHFIHLHYSSLFGVYFIDYALDIRYTGLNIETVWK